MDAQRTAHDQPDDDGAFAAIVARIDLDAKTDDPTTTQADLPLENGTSPAQALPTPASVDPTLAGHRPCVVEPAEPTLPTAPHYWGVNGLAIVYWIAILTGGIGQITFFGSLFGMGWPGYVAAGVIATTFETVMVSSGDTALTFRVQGRHRRQWVPFLLIAFLAAGVAAWMNLTHFWADSAALAMLFGGVAALGFVLHVLDGMVKGSDYLEAKRAYDDEVERKRAKAEARADAEHERQLAERASVPAALAPEPAAPAGTSPEPQAKAAAKATAAAKKSGGSFDRDTARAVLGDELDTLGPAEVNRRMAALGYATVSPSTIRRWRR